LNQISGTLPTEFGKAKNLFWLYVQNCIRQFELQIYNTPTNGFTSEMQHNTLSGTVPSELGAIPLQHMSVLILISFVLGFTEHREGVLKTVLWELNF
jgi:hypothetical protein